MTTIHTHGGAPLVSVIIPAHNAERYLEDTLRSVQGQTHALLDVIVIDDGSTDHTADIVESFGDRRVRCVRQSNMEKAAARNTGVRVARGSWIAFLDADDLWAPEKIQAQLARAHETGADVVYSAMRMIDEDGRDMPKVWTRPATWGTIAEDLLFFNVIEGSASSVLVRATVLRAAGEFDVSLSRLVEDQDMWRRLALRGAKFAFVDEPHVVIRLHAASATSRPESAAQQIEAGLLYLRKVEAELPARYAHLRASIRYRWLLFVLLIAKRFALGDHQRTLRRAIGELGPSYRRGLILDTTWRALVAKLPILAALGPKVRVPRVHPWRICDG